METRKRTPRRRSHPKTSENSLPIPIDLIFEIFSRLTLKSLARCRCVSRLWASLLRRPYFTEMFLTRSSSRPKLLFACTKQFKTSELFLFSADQPHDVAVNSSPVVANYHMKIPFGKYYHVSGLVHGFLVLVNEPMGKKQSVTVICSPSTGQVLTVPRVETRRIKVRRMVGYDPIDNHFKVLSMSAFIGRNVVADQHHVMTLGTKNPLWRRIQCCSLTYNPHSEICIDGVLYYPTFNTITKTCMIVCFDVRCEKFSFMEVEFIKDGVRNGRMINYSGKLGLYQPEGSLWIDGTCTSLKFWVLEDLEKQEWSAHEYLLPALWEDLAGKAFFRCLGVTRENEIVLSPSRPDPMFYLIYFNYKRNTLVRVNIQGIDASKYDIVRTFLYHVENVKFM